MRNVTLGVVGLLVLASLARPAAAQSALQKLEQRLGTQSSSSQTTGYLGLTADDRQDMGRGVRIVEIVPDGPAQQAGLQVNDLVVAIGSTTVKSMNDFASVLEPSPPGAKLTFKVERSGQTQELPVTLGTRPVASQPLMPGFGPPGSGSNSTGMASPRPPMLGVQLATVTPDAVQALHLPVQTGALVVSVVQGSPAQVAGIASQAVIVGYNGQPVASPDALTQLVAGSQPGDQVRVTYFYRGTMHEKEITLGATADATPLPAAPLILQSPPTTDRTQYLEQRVLQLEQRVSELEKKLDAK